MSIHELIPFYSNTIPVVFTTDNNYVPYMSVTIQSIIENSSSDRKYAFFVLHREVTEASKNILINQIEHYKQFTIEFIDVSFNIAKYDLYISRHITIETYFRFFIPEMFIKYAKVIYLDCDIVVCTDIAELYDIDIENYVLGAMRDIDTVNYFYGAKKDKKLGGNRNSLTKLSNPSNYFCAGICIFNIHLFSKNISTNDLFELAMSNKWDYHDQDVLNILTEGKTLLLSFNWGFYNTRRIKYLPEDLKNEYFNAREYPKIVHFTQKPWKKEIYNLHFDLFWKYATRTPFISIILDRMDIPKEPTSLPQLVISKIAHRKGLNLKFILRCLAAWLLKR